MSKISVIRVSFSKQANDANYGSETARCEFEVVAEEGEDLGIFDANHAISAARVVVHDELAKSPNASVRYAVEERRQNTEQVTLEDLPF
jgi:hypothetical protein